MLEAQPDHRRDESMKKIYTFKNIDEGIKTQSAKNRARSILRLATDGAGLERCGVVRFRLAKKLYNGVILLNEYKDRELELDSIDNEHCQKRADHYSQLQLEAVEELQKIARRLGLKVYSSTFWHCCKLSNRQDVYTDKF